MLRKVVISLLQNDTEIGLCRKSLNTLKVGQKMTVTVWRLLVFNGTRFHKGSSTVQLCKLGVTNFTHQDFSLYSKFGQNKGWDFKIVSTYIFQTMLVRYLLAS